MIVPTVQNAFRHIVFLRNATLRTVNDLSTFAPVLNEFGTFGSELRLLYRGIVVILNDINVQPNDMLLQLFDEDYRSLYTDPWSFPPPTARYGLEQVRRILEVVHEFVIRFDGPSFLADFNSMFEGQFRFVLLHVQRVFDGLDSARNALTADGQVDPPRGQRGRNYWQINNFPVRIATNEEGGRECIVCLEQIIVGQPIKFLPCSHCFHARCIDQWLSIRNSCPIDRSSTSNLIPE